MEIFNGQIIVSSSLALFPGEVGGRERGGGGGGVSVNTRFTLRRCETKAVNCRKCSNIFDNVRWHFDSVN